MSGGGERKKIWIEQGWNMHLFGSVSYDIDFETLKFVPFFFAIRQNRALLTTSVVGLLFCAHV